MVGTVSVTCVNNGQADYNAGNKSRFVHQCSTDRQTHFGSLKFQQKLTTRDSRFWTPEYAENPATTCWIFSSTSCWNYSIPACWNYSKKRQSSPAVRNGCVSFFCHFCVVVSHTDCQGSIRSSGELIGCTIALISAAATAGRRHPDSQGKKKRNDNVWRVCGTRVAMTPGPWTRKWSGWRQSN